MNSKAQNVQFLPAATGPIETVQRKYERLSDIVTEYGGKVHGSQRDRDPKNWSYLLVYYEVPIGQREEVKQRFNNIIISELKIYQKLKKMSILY